MSWLLYSTWATVGHGLSASLIIAGGGSRWGRSGILWATVAACALTSAIVVPATLSIRETGGHDFESGVFRALIVWLLPVIGTGVAISAAKARGVRSLLIGLLGYLGFLALGLILGLAAAVT